MSTTLSAEEEDFVRWMNELDLDEVNLLEPELDAPAPDANERAKLSGGEGDLRPPPSRGVGWDES